MQRQGRVSALQPPAGQPRSLSNALCSKGAGTISDGLLSNSTVTSLPRVNDIDSEGVEHLAKALATNRFDVALLEWNSISKEGAQVLSELLIDDSLALAALNLAAGMASATRERRCYPTRSQCAHRKGRCATCACTTIGCPRRRRCRSRVR